VQDAPACWRKVEITCFSPANGPDRAEIAWLQ